MVSDSFFSKRSTLTSLIFVPILVMWKKLSVQTAAKKSMLTPCVGVTLPSICGFVRNADNLSSLAHVANAQFSILLRSTISWMTPFNRKTKTNFSWINAYGKHLESKFRVVFRAKSQKICPVCKRLKLVYLIRYSLSFNHDFSICWPVFRHWGVSRSS